ncbi:hypothetical protein [Gelidibacter salicanalis]|nr:hypothetical protein [Gelidibacter salicanalis]
MQPKIKRNNIGFVYNNRFRIDIEGAANVATLWKYAKSGNLEQLEIYK